jgi:hypothetical protein
LALGLLEESRLVFYFKFLARDLVATGQRRLLYAADVVLAVVALRLEDYAVDA